MRGELVNADLEQVSVGCIRWWVVHHGHFVPLQFVTPSADFWGGEIGANVMCKAVPDLADKLQVCRDDLVDKPQTIADPHSVSP